ncbi:MAG TPA: tetratricopeptide repeat protein [Myxococcota bacterium]
MHRLCAALLAAQALACAGLVGMDRRVVGVESVADEGDAIRRASTRLVLDGLASDAGGNADRALSQYERAVQVDSGNPYAYLALARYHVAQRDSARALTYLDRAQVLFESEDVESPRVEAHLLGLRGNALQLQGRIREGDALLQQAARSAPGVWGDRSLSADELR